MKRSRNDNDQMSPAAAALRRRSVFRDARASSSQLTDAQLIAGALEMQRSIGPSNMSTTVVINSPEELALYRQRTRAELEERVKRGYAFLGNWVKYARWEAQQKDWGRMRGVLERAVKFHGANPVLWRDYAELEQEGGFINHSRAVWERGVTALPSATDLWLKYIMLEQVVGQDGRVRDLFNRWVSGPTPPTYAWQLFALFEAQQQRPEACRNVLQRYVQDQGTVDSWLFYGETELEILKNAGNAAMVYASAMSSLPSEYVNGERDCRIPLAWANTLVAAQKFSDARELYHRLLRECTVIKALETIFAAYKRFERLYGSVEDSGAVASAIARVMYQHRIMRDPHDFDAYVAQFLLVKNAAAAGGKGGCDCHSLISDTKGEMHDGALKCLATVVEMRIDGEKDAVSAQRQAVVVMAYARLMELRGDVNAARSALARCIRRFPFGVAFCPRLWVEAASLEERHGDFTQARKLLSASLSVSACPEVFDAALRLEASACAAGELTQEDHIQLSRTIYETAIKQFPQDVSLWEGYAKMEEKAQQFHRSDALRAACIRTFSEAARSVASLSDRYEMLEKVDQVWARRLALKRRLLRLARKKAGDISAGHKEVEELTCSLRCLYQQLLDSVWNEYIYEALRWRDKNIPTTGVLSPPPLRHPEVLVPAVARWTQAVGAATNFVMAQTSDHNEYEVSPAEWLRATFRGRFERCRPELLRNLGGDDSSASFEAVQQLKRWVEFLLSPNGTEWRRFEATHGTTDTLEAAKECTQPTTRRTRLFGRKRT